MKKNTPQQGTLSASSGALTGSYVMVGSIIKISGFDQMALLVNYTKGDETTMEFKIQVSDTFAFTDAYEVASLALSAGVNTVNLESYQKTASGKFVVDHIKIGILNYAKVLVKATGGTPTGTAGFKYMLDNVER